MKQFFTLLAFAVTCSAGLTAQVIDSGLVVHYQFEDNLTDEVSDATAEAVGNLSYDEGIIGRGVRYSDDDSYFLTPDTTLTPGTPDVGGTPVSFALFVKHDAAELGAQRQNYLQQLNGCDATGRTTLYLQGPDSPTNADSIISFVGNATSKSGIGLPTADEWTHLALTIDPATGIFTFYRDGVETSQDTLTGNKAVEAACGSYIVGHHKSLTNDELTFDGVMDDLRLYNRVITAEEVAEIAALSNIVSTRPALVRGGMKLFPNPVGIGEAINLNVDHTVFTPGESVQVRVFDAVGRAVLTQAFNTTPARITLNQPLKAGVYTVFLSNGARSTSLPVLVK
ncbi:LamG-like jellyroll fold domain-containing protein [Neolewinella antarctica]|uniref:LamG-like jellyroll fold domain-containing protein n=1 Tax=Neolewinella antarctica TaxID=442734 RepID=A0ABX0XDE0_9BACT|nr:LamG-like jellyroll fold domain-containing protein [Neolewinella antarctica]NJC27095.1 hypothetical protein [Neolewinella antarctica]